MQADRIVHGVLSENGSCWFPPYSELLDTYTRCSMPWWRLQQAVANADRSLRTWMPIPLRELEPCIPSPSQQRSKQQH